MTQPPKIFDPEHHPEDHKKRRVPLSGLRSSFLTGLVVIAPIGLTVWLFWTLIGWVDSFVLPFVPDYYKPEVAVNRWLGYDNPEDMITVNIRGVGVAVFLLFTLFVGWVAKGFLGRGVLAWAEGLVDRMPVVRSVYNGLKQLAETIVAQSDSSFEKACLVEYPRTGVWAVAFVSTTARGEVDARIPRDQPLISVFLPTTPNPTSGFLLFVPRDDVIYLDMSVEDAAKLVISAGLVYPSDKKGAKAFAEAAAASKKASF